MYSFSHVWKIYEHVYVECILIYFFIHRKREKKLLIHKMLSWQLSVKFVNKLGLRQKINLEKRNNLILNKNIILKPKMLTGLKSVLRDPWN